MMNVIVNVNAKYMTNIEKLNQLVEKAKDFPNAVIEYSFELPKGFKTKGVKIVFNKNVPKSVGASITYKY